MERKNITFTLKAAEEKKPKNQYVINIECDSNDGDYMRERYIAAKSEMTELDVLMIAYLNLDRYSVPKNWEDANEAMENDYNYAFGGSYVEENMRFGEVEDYGTSGWLYTYATNRDLLLFCGAIDERCHSVESIDVTFYDENGNMFECVEPDLGKLFASEQEFIEYVKSLPEYGKVLDLDWWEPEYGSCCETDVDDDEDYDEYDEEEENEDED